MQKPKSMVEDMMTAFIRVNVSASVIKSGHQSRLAGRSA